MKNQNSPKHSPVTEHASELRRNQTKSEGLLWSILRAKQVCGLKFRRQHPVGPFFADFACVSRQLIVEIDGAYHDQTAEVDMNRELFLTSQGWKVVRFTAEDVEADPELVAIGISNLLGLEFEYVKRNGSFSGMMSERDALRVRTHDDIGMNEKCKPPDTSNPPRAKGPTLPEGG